MVDRSPNANETLQGAYGAVEVAIDLVGRAEAAYRRDFDVDNTVLEAFMRAMSALTAIEHLFLEKVSSGSLGPAA